MKSFFIHLTNEKSFIFIFLNFICNTCFVTKPFTKKDSASLIGFKKLRDENFNKNLAKTARGFYTPKNSIRAAPVLNDGNTNSFQTLSLPGLGFINLEFSKTRAVNCVVLKEYLQKGQHCKKFTISLINKKQKSVKEIAGTTIGRKLIITFPSTEVDTIRVAIEEQKGNTSISEIESYLINEALIEK
jgi:alpha-L-fucosidase